MKNTKNFLLSIICSVSFLNAYSQLVVTPNPAEFGLCPGQHTFGL